MSEQSTTDGILAIIRENFTLLAALVLGYFAAVEFGYAPELSAPDGTGLLVGAGIVTVAVGWITAGKIYGLLPEDHGIYLYEIDAKNDDEIGLWELSEDQWEDIEVVGGRLNHLNNCKHRAYECLEYRPEDNIAVGTWRRSIDGSEIVGHHESDTALSIITEVKDELEPEARYSGALKRNLSSIIRRLDRRRAMEQNRALDEHLTPSFGNEQSMDDILVEELPDAILPDRLQQDDAESLAEEGGEAAGMAFEMLDELKGESEPVQNGHEDAIEESNE